ncbi:hypothetical protein [Marinovum algicola]|uniref:hypothetical protein n=1 Tax=Marinovum algicola TaxID=42444 RepID=UPI003B525D41
MKPPVYLPRRKPAFAEPLEPDARLADEMGTADFEAYRQMSPDQRLEFLNDPANGFAPPVPPTIAEQLAEPPAEDPDLRREYNPDIDPGEVLREPFDGPAPFSGNYETPVQALEADRQRLLELDLDAFMDGVAPPPAPAAPKSAEAGAVPKGQPRLSDVQTDADAAQYIRDMADYIGPDRFYALPLPEVFETLGFGDVPLAAAAEYQAMTRDQRAQVMDRLAADPLITIEDALRPEAQAAPEMLGGVRGADGNEGLTGDFDLPGPGGASDLAPADSGRPKLSDVRTDADAEAYLRGMIDFIGPDRFYDLPLGDAFAELGFGEIAEAAAAEYQAMTADERRQVFERLANDPMMTVEEALRPDGFDAELGGGGRPDIDGGAGDDTLPGGGESAPEDAPGLLRRIVGDVGRGAVEASTQALGGARDAAQGALSGVAAFDEWASDGLGLPKLQILNDKGEFDLEILSPEAGQEAEVLLPEIREAKSVTGGMVRGLSQFLTGFVAGGKVLSGLGWVAGAGRAGRAATQATISDFVAFDGHEERLSNLIEEFPALENPVTAYLAADIDDGELEGRLKNIAEGGLSDVLISGTISALRGVRAARRVKADARGETYAEAAARLAGDPTRRAKIGAKSGVLPGPLSFRPDDDALEADLKAFIAKMDAKVADGIAEDVPVEDAARALRLGKVETGSGDVYVNWSRIDTPEDVTTVIQQLADADAKGVDAARRGVRTNARTKLDADKENAWADLMERRKGAPLNAEKTLALRQLWASSAEKLRDAAELVMRAPNAENSFLFRRAMALHGTIQREALAVRTETARALQQWKIPAGSSALMARQMEEVVTQYGSTDVATDLAERIVGLARSGEHGAVDYLTRKSALSATHDAVFEFWVNAVLSGPKTHMVNALSNAGVVFLAQIERSLAAKLSAARGGGLDGVDAAEAGAMVSGMIGALPDAFRMAGRSFVSGQSGFGLQKLELPRARSISTEVLGNTRNETFNRAINLPVLAQGINALGTVVTVPGRALGAEDEYFKTINARMEIHAQAARTVAQEVREGRLAPEDAKGRMVDLIAEPSEETMMQAREFAQYQTFTNDAGRYANLIAKFRNDAPILRFVIPFLNTPANILRFATERSPGAMLLGDVRADVAAGGRRAHMALARMGLGSVTMLTALDYAMNGQITGAGPSHQNERQALMRAGWKPYSVKIGDRYWAYNRIDPMGAQLGVAANMAEIAMNSDLDPGEDIDEVIYSAMGAVGQSMMDKAYVQGLSDLFSAMSEPKRFAPRYMERLAGSFVPTFVREIEGVQDPVLRRATNTLEEIKSRIPGLSADLPARHDLWGREITYQSGLGAAYDAVSPVYTSAYDPEPIDQEFRDIDYFPGLPSTSITINKERFVLRNEPEAYERYVVLQGATPASDYPLETRSDGSLTSAAQILKDAGQRDLRQTLNDLVEGKHPRSAEYADMDSFDRETEIQKIISAFRRAAKDRLISEFPDIFRAGTGIR